MSSASSVFVSPARTRHTPRVRSRRSGVTAARTPGPEGDSDETGASTHVHFIGIGGAGVSALALVALSRGHVVSGSDLRHSTQLARVEAEGATCYVGHFAQNVGSIPRDAESSSTVPGDLQISETVPDAIVVSSAVPGNNVEVLFAREAGIPVYNRSQWLARITKRKAVVAVAGTHGKTTTSSMLSVVMRENGFDISALVGGRVRQFPGKANAIGGSDELFVVEADEYDGAFLGLSPTVAIITNIDFEHPDMFEDILAVQRSFARFVRRVCDGGCIIACGDDSNIQRVLISQDTAFVTYGFGDQNMWRAVDISTNSAGGSDFSITRTGEKICEVSLPLPGRHNVLNALAAFIAALALSKARDGAATGPGPACQLKSFSSLADASAAPVRCDAPVIAKIVAALEGYKGIARRMQHVGSIGSCAVYDDYAHHPTAIRAVIDAMRQRFVGSRLVVAFQPHTFSRTAALLPDFAAALVLADRVIIAAVYDARGEDENSCPSQVSGQDLARLVGVKAVYSDSLRDVRRHLVMEGSLDRGDGSTVKEVENIRTVFLVLGAGSSNQLSSVLLASLSTSPSCTSKVISLGP